MIEILLKFDPTESKAGGPVWGSPLEQLDDLYHPIWSTSISQLLYTNEHTHTRTNKVM